MGRVVPGCFVVCLVCVRVYVCVHVYVCVKKLIGVSLHMHVDSCVSLSLAGYHQTDIY